MVRCNSYQPGMDQQDSATGKANILNPFPFPSNFDKALKFLPTSFPFHLTKMKPKFPSLFLPIQTELKISFPFPSQIDKSTSPSSLVCTCHTIFITIKAFANTHAHLHYLQCIFTHDTACLYHCKIGVI